MHLVGARVKEIALMREHAISPGKGATAEHRRSCLCSALWLRPLTSFANEQSRLLQLAIS